MLRKVSFYNSYVEGWALYSEQLADELGGYDSIQRAGYLQSFLFRSARLVVDTGLNSKGWTREQAVDYMTRTTGFARPRVQREVERYCVSIGQACSYKIGHLAWLRAREQAKADAWRSLRPQAVPRNFEGRRDAADHSRTARKGTRGGARLSRGGSGDK